MPVESAGKKFRMLVQNTCGLGLAKAIFVSLSIKYGKDKKLSPPESNTSPLILALLHKLPADHPLLILELTSVLVSDTFLTIILCAMHTNEKCSSPIVIFKKAHPVSVEF